MRKTKIGIIGLHQSGKSLLINCLLKRMVSKVGTGSATTHTIVSYSYSDDEYAEYLDSKGWHTIETKDVVKFEDNDSIYKINVHLDNLLLKAFTLVDLPGTGYDTKDNATTTAALENIDCAILLATDVKEFSNSSSFYTNTLQMLQKYNIPYYFFLNCTNITKWSPTNKQNIEVAKSDLDLLQIYEPLSLGYIDDFPLVNLIWYWCSIVDDTDELFVKYYDSIQNHFERKGKYFDKRSLEADSKFSLIWSIFDKGNRAYIELMRDFRKELNRIKEELCPIGTIQAFAFEKIPQGWLICDGDTHKINKFTELFKAIGNTFGGDGIEDFNVPDLRNKFIRGWGMDKKARKFGSPQDDALQGHSHKFVEKNLTIAKSGGHTHLFRPLYGDTANPKIFSDTDMVEKFSNVQDKVLSYHTSYNGEHSHKISATDNPISDPETSKYDNVRIDTETRPENLALLYCIRAK